MTNGNTIDVLTAIHAQATEMRSRLKLGDGAPLEVTVPNRLAVDLIKSYGSLQQAADAVFDPGTVRIVDAYWRDFCLAVTENVNQRFRAA